MIELVIRQPGHPDRVVRLSGGVYGVGRAEDNAIVLGDAAVSRHHAQISVDGSRVWVEDRNSANGVLFRGQRVSRAELGDGDEATIDPFVLRFTIRSDDAPVAAWLQVLSGPEAGRRHPLDRNRVTMGRAEDQDIVVADPGASRRHGVVERQGDRWMLIDPGSANGLFLDGKRVQTAPLNEGAEIRIGGTSFRFMTLRPPSQTRTPAPPPASAHAPTLPPGPAIPPAEPAGGGSSLMPVLLVVGIVLALIVTVLLFTLAFLAYRGGFLG